ncbi:cytochrome c-type biogenesis protein CcmH [Lysobacter sp. TY2-98]|uniref:cytochrome c-type biogenesis protein n=1 Tax=Lysobacter sp. TY2-98 TaxID=2290922 RepID=UPI000E2010E3|nr:cytochrome c-type biogenesis protein [Lysobacter sp. TY2-98]AXK73565.1 cytochrome c-type biogenesis protein CcmH [Lysobacter sp. TY2-98]
MLMIGTVSAQVADRRPLEFRNAAEEARFRDLTHQLRCVMCQNQSIADSEALIAIDLRREILQLMREGRSDDEIRRFLVDRYGEFVLYKPEVEPSTWLLWFGPVLVLLTGGAVVWRVVRDRSRNRADVPVANDDGGDW